MDLSTLLHDLTTGGALAADYNAGALQLQVKTNFGPPVTLYNQSGQPGPGAAVTDFIGLHGGVRVLDASGNVIAQIGDWPDTDPVKVALALGVLGFLSYTAVRLLRGGHCDRRRNRHRPRLRSRRSYYY